MKITIIAVVVVALLGGIYWGFFRSPSITDNGDAPQTESQDSPGKTGKLTEKQIKEKQKKIAEKISEQNAIQQQNQQNIQQSISNVQNTMRTVDEINRINRVNQQLHQVQKQSRP